MSVDCPAILTTGVTGVPTCADGTGTPVAWVQSIPFDITQLDQGGLAAAFSVGFCLIGVCWFFGRAASIVLGMIKSA